MPRRHFYGSFFPSGHIPEYLRGPVPATPAFTTSPPTSAEVEKKKKDGEKKVDQPETTS